MSDESLLPELIEVADHLQGDTFPGLRFTITRNGVAKDLTGSAITMTFLHRNRRTSETHVLTLGDGLTIIDGPNGVFDLDQIDVLDWTAGQYKADAEITYSDGEVKTPLKFDFNVVQDKTNNS